MRRMTVDPKVSVDPKSLELAEHFLQDDDEADLSATERAERRLSLAQAIQRAVEDWTDDEASEA